MSLVRLVLAYLTVAGIASAISGSVLPLAVCTLAALTCCWIARRFLH